MSAIAFACPANAATATGSGRAVIVTPLSLVNDLDLRFGLILPSAAAGTVTINAFTDARTSTGGVTLYGSGTGAATFIGRTDVLSHLKIDLPTGSITLTNGVGGTMTVNNFTLNGDKNQWMPANTTFVLKVGGTLNVGANQMPGSYSGEFAITVNYR